MAYETQKHLPTFNNYHKYHESAVINLTTIFAVLLSSVCQAVLIILRLNKVQEGILLIVTLRDCLWMYPMIYLLFVPKVSACLYIYDVVHIYIVIIALTHDQYNVTLLYSLVAITYLMQLQ